MTRYRVKAEDGKGESRTTYLSADSADEARALVEGREAEYAAKQYSEEELAAAREATAEGKRSFSEVVHDQSEPYKVVDVVARSQIKSESKAERKGA